MQTAKTKLPVASGMHRHLNRYCQAVLRHREISTMATHLAMFWEEPWAPVWGMSSIFQHIPTYSNIFQHIPTCLQTGKDEMKSRRPFLWPIGSCASIMLQRETCWRPCRPAICRAWPDFLFHLAITKKNIMFTTQPRNKYHLDYVDVDYIDSIINSWIPKSSTWI